MKKYTAKIALFVLIALSPLIVYQLRKYIPAYYKRPLVYDIIIYVPYIFYFVTAFLGIKLNQSRIFFTSLLWIILYYLIHNTGLPLFDIKVKEIYLMKVLAVSSLVTLILLYAFKEKYIFGLYGFIRLMFTFLPIIGSVYLVKNIYPEGLPYILEQPIFNIKMWVLPDLTLFLLVGIVVFFILQEDKSIKYFIYGLYINLVPLLLSLNFTAGRGRFDINTRLFNVISFSVMGIIFLYALYRMYWEKVYIDELTGIPNRRAFDEYLKKLGRKYTIAMMDIDHFKKFNDTYGHAEGDNVLRFVAKHIAEEAQAPVFRYGGEEFSAVYKGIQARKVFNVLDLMRANLASNVFYLRKSEEARKYKTKKDRKDHHTDFKIVKVTLSVGISHKTPSQKVPHDVIVTADKALYKAKEKGRNRCEIS